MAKKEFLVQEEGAVLKDFIKANSELLETLAKDGKTAQVSLQPEIKSKLWSALWFHASVLLCSGGLRFCGGVFWGKSQNHTAGHVFPDIWPLRKGL